jgi:hypothetical protein
MDCAGKAQRRRRFRPHEMFTTFREPGVRTKAMLKPPQSRRSRVSRTAKQSRSVWSAARSPPLWSVPPLIASLQLPVPRAAWWKWPRGGHSGAQRSVGAAESLSRTECVPIIPVFKFQVLCLSFVRALSVVPSSVVRGTRILDFLPPTHQRHGVRGQSAAATALSPARNVHNLSGTRRAHESDAEASPVQTLARWPNSEAVTKRVECGAFTAALVRARSDCPA